MRQLLALALLASAAVPSLAADAPLLKLRPVPFTDVQIHDSFWSPRQEVNRTASLPLNFEMLEKSGNIRNLELAAAKATSGFTGPVFMDSDVHKALEAASYSLASHPDPALEKRLDEIIAKLAAAQLADGYLDSYYIVKEPGRRWTNLRDNHELHCAGHMIEAAVAHFRATGKTNFLTVAAKLADHIDSVFGPGKRMGYPGHPEIVKGHAVRATYLLSGVTDVAGETQDPALLRMINRVGRNTTGRNMYITGGIGPNASNEGFTHDYDLPNLTAYQEACAAVALAQWNHRLALLYGDARFADVFERSLYNGVLAGVSLDGKRFFYVNPLESEGHHHRSPWFGCACCPPNVARTLASLGGYAYVVSDDALWVSLYIQGSATASVNGRKVTLNVETDYPWDGKVVLKPHVDQTSKFDLCLRIPGWCHGATVAVNGENVSEPTTDRGYIVVG